MTAIVMKVAIPTSGNTVVVDYEDGARTVRVYNGYHYLGHMEDPPQGKMTIEQITGWLEGRVGDQDLVASFKSQGPLTFTMG